MSERMTPKEAAAYLGFSTSTLEKWRRGKKVWDEADRGPRYTSLNGRIWYRRDWLEDWENSVWAKARKEQACKVWGDLL